LLPASSPDCARRRFQSLLADDGAAVDDPGVRGGGGGRGGRAAHAPGAPRRAEPDRRARVLAPAAHSHRDPLRGLPAPRCVRAAPLRLTEPSAGPISKSDAPSGAGADIYWKKEHRLVCTSEVCTADERVRFEKTVSGRRASRVGICLAPLGFLRLSFQGLLSVAGSRYVAVGLR
jgi:hypothetical protein